MTQAPFLGFLFSGSRVECCLGVVSLGCFLELVAVFHGVFLAEVFRLEHSGFVSFCGDELNLICSTLSPKHGSIQP